jgi:uncharacterized protein
MHAALSLFLLFATVIAAAQGHAAAQFNLGAMHENGHGVDQDHAEALRLYRLAAAQGHAAAASAIARMGA